MDASSPHVVISARQRCGLCNTFPAIAQPHKTRNARTVSVKPDCMDTSGKNDISFQNAKAGTGAAECNSEELLLTAQAWKGQWVAGAH